MNNGTKSQLEPHSVIIAITNTVSSLILMIVYLPCIYVIVKHDKFYQNASYKLILLMAFFDITQLICIGPATAVYQMTKDLTVYDTRIWGAIVMSAYFGYLLSIGFLSMERFCKIMTSKMWHILFDGKRICYWLGAALICASGVFVALLTKNHQAKYDPAGYSWYYDETPGREVIQTFDIVVGVLSPVIMIVSYVSIFIHLKQMNDLTTNSSNRHERQLLYQSVLASTLMVINQVAFHTVPKITTNKWAYWACHLTWVSNCGMNGVIYITFNKSIRDALAATFNYRKVHVLHNQPGAVPSVHMTTGTGGLVIIGYLIIWILDKRFEGRITDLTF